MKRGRYFLQKPQPEMTESEIAEALTKMAQGIYWNWIRGRTGTVRLVGIERRGKELAARLKPMIEVLLGVEDRKNLKVELGSIRIRFYNERLEEVDKFPKVEAVNLPDCLDHEHVIIVDDVLYRGWTIDTAMQVIHRRGRPQQTRTACLFEREGDTQVPIRLDSCGRSRRVSPDEVVKVWLKELDGYDRVDVVLKSEARASVAV